MGELRALAASSANAADAADARLCGAQLELARNRLQPAFREATALLDLYRSRGQTAELVPVLLLLAEIHQHADSAVVALPHVLSALSLCEFFSMEHYRGYAMTMLAELQLRLGATTQAVELLDEAMPQLLEHAPAALLADAQHTLGVSWHAAIVCSDVLRFTQCLPGSARPASSRVLYHLCDHSYFRGTEGGGFPGRQHAHLSQAWRVQSVSATAAFEPVHLYLHGDRVGPVRWHTCWLERIIL